jgi:hypothetical protein
VALRALQRHPGSDQAEQESWSRGLTGQAGPTKLVVTGNKARRADKIKLEPVTIAIASKAHKARKLRI